MFVVDKDSRTLRLSIMMNVNVTNKGKKMQPTNVQASTMNTLAAREFLRSFMGVCGGEVRLVVVRGGEDIFFRVRVWWCSSVAASVECRCRVTYVTFPVV